MKKKVDILLLGSGGREHALLAKLAESPRAGRLYVAPGNGGMDVMAEKVAGLDAESPVEVAEWARAHSATSTGDSASSPATFSAITSMPPLPGAT